MPKKGLIYCWLAAMQKQLIWTDQQQEQNCADSHVVQSKSASSCSAQLNSKVTLHWLTVLIIWHVMALPAVIEMKTHCQVMVESGQASMLKLETSLRLDKNNKCNRRWQWLKLLMWIISLQQAVVKVAQLGCTVWLQWSHNLLPSMLPLFIN